MPGSIRGSTPPFLNTRRQPSSSIFVTTSPISSWCAHTSTFGPFSPTRAYRFSSASVKISSATGRNHSAIRAPTAASYPGTPGTCATSSKNFPMSKEAPPFVKC